MSRALNRPPLLIALVLAALITSTGLACKPGDFTDWTPEEWRSASVKDVRSELDRGADIHARDGSRARDGSGRPPLVSAARFNENPAVTELLLNRGADINDGIRDGYWTPLHHAALHREPAVAALLLDRGADIHAKSDNGVTPLHLAANREPAVAALLLDRGADIHAKVDNGPGAGYTPLHFAAEGNREPAIVALLLDRGADIHAKTDNGVTPLHLAASNEDWAVAALLLDRGADIHAKDYKGRTPLHYAARLMWRYGTSVVKFLIARGAKRHARDNDGDTPCYYGLQELNPYNPPDVVRFLRRFCH